MTSKQQISLGQRKTFAQWITNLRSGKFIQGKGILRRDIFDAITNVLVRTEHCCLGVLDHSEAESESDDYMGEGLYCITSCRSVITDTEFSAYTGITTEILLNTEIFDPHKADQPLTVSGLIARLTQWNDGDVDEGCGDNDYISDHGHKTFPEIAEYLEQLMTQIDPNWREGL